VSGGRRGEIQADGVNTMNTNSKYPETYCYFYAEGFECDPEDVTRSLRITPTEIRRRGEAGKTGQPVKLSSWKIEDSALRNDYFFENHLESVLEKIEPSAAAIRQLQRECAVGINCVGYFSGCNPGFEIKPQLLSRLSALGLTLGFDLYTLPEGD
jgi:hypothetical protein